MTLKIFLIAMAVLVLSAPQVMAADMADIFRRSLESDPLLSSAEYERYAAAGDKSAACGKLWPQLKVPGMYIVFDQDDPGSVLGESTASTNGGLSGKQGTIGIAASQTLFDMPKFSQCRKARMARNRGDLSYERALEDLIFRASSNPI